MGVAADDDGQPAQLADTLHESDGQPRLTKKIVTSWLREGVEKARPAKFFYDRGVT